MNHPISMTSLRRAAQQIMEIDEAGFGHRLDEEVSREMLEDESRYDRSKLDWQLRLAMSGVNDFANRLVKLLECDYRQALAVAIEIFDYRTRRAIVLEMLPRMVNELRQREAQERRNLRLGRAS